MDLSNAWVFDIETDSLNASKIHVLSCSKVGSKDIFSTSDHEKMKSFLQGVDILIGHNIVRFDIPTLEKLLGIKIKAKIIDTLAFSWYLFPDRLKHGLEEWGEEFGVSKPEINDWKNLSYETYRYRCEEDVKINSLLFDKIWFLLNHIYEDKNDLSRFIDYLGFKLYCARLQEEAGWKLDIEYTEKALEKLLELQKEKVEILKKAMPPVPVKQTKKPPKVMYKKDGSLSSHGSSWFKLLENYKLNSSVDEIEIIVGYDEPNPSSHQQIKDWLFSLGWKPQTFKQVKNKEGEVRDIPQINKEKQKGGGVCNSIKLLYEKEPSLEALDGLSILNHRISILNGFLRDCDSNGFLRARISGLTNTLRFKHTEIVNLPKINVEYGEYPRSCLVAREGYELCGSDMSSLEDRIKQHFIYPLDPEYVEEMNRDDYDPHLSLALLANKVTQEQVRLYISGEDKSIKTIRDVFKNGNYA